jgi:hypothetical protein
MAELIPVDEQSNYETFRDCLSEPVLKLLAAPSEKLKSRKKRHVKKSSKDQTGMKEKDTKPFTSHSETKASDAEDLGDFIEVHFLPLSAPSIHQLTPLSTSAP